MGNSIELYPLVGSAIRDVAQARFVADLYSRQISHTYERDSVLRRFPVPRAEIEEAEINLLFSVVSVEVDPARRQSRNAAIGSLFDQYSIKIVRGILDDLREALKPKPQNGGTAQGPSLDSFEKRVISAGNFELLAGRLLIYFNDNVEDVMRTSGAPKSDSRWADFENDEVKEGVFDQLDDDARNAAFYGLPEAAWTKAVKAVQDAHAWRDLLDEMADAINAMRDKYPDCKIMVDIDPKTLGAPGANVSSIKIKASVKNYKWSKVDVDKGDLRNIRTLNPE
jgi:hypothetical protein